MDAIFHLVRSFSYWWLKANVRGGIGFVFCSLVLVLFVVRSTEMTSGQFINPSPSQFKTFEAVTRKQRLELARRPGLGRSHPLRPYQRISVLN